MYISPYIQEAISQPVQKIFNTPEDVIFDTKLSFHEKKKILSKMESALPSRKIQKN